MFCYLTFCTFDVAVAFACFNVVPLLLMGFSFDGFL